MSTRRDFLRAAAGATAALSGAPFVLRGRFQLFGWSPVEYSARAIRLMQEAVVIDMLAPWTLHFAQQSKWFANPESFTDADFTPYLDSGINVWHIAVGFGGPDAHQTGLAYLGGWNSFLAGNDHRLLRVDSAGDFDRIKRSGKVGVLLGVQNADHFRRPEDVDLFHGLGQRVSQLTYNSRNWIGSGSTERRDDGISDFGATIIARMNKVGMAVDTGHCGDRTTLDAFEISKAPVLVTHSNVRALNPGHPRCKPDEVIQAVGKAGSVMGITGVRNFVKNSEPTTVEDYLNQFDYVKQMIGSEHLGIGSDIDLNGYDDMPPEAYKRLKAGYKDSYAFREKIDIEGIDHPKRMFDVTEGLIRRKYTDAEILGILGGNFRRVLAEIWKGMPA
ncbi:MAG TPA: membrane dipeptidase [Gemmatimonadales bacterium]